ncbi:ras and EF-hand domain-containing protein-like [Saccopteryx leptura]|uniref:ras and EF-hand domain-containing protein-like n=1 Tax=Saccopteryx leptura TaxID=249018 RepID=UPI00339D10BF
MSRKWPNQPDKSKLPRLPKEAGGPGLSAVATVRALGAPGRVPELSRPPRSGGMEADADQEELARHRSVFAACDAHRSGRLQREFSALSAEHRVRPADAEAVFQRLDSDRDGVITFQEFARGFRGARRGGRRRGCEQHGPALSVSRATSDPGESEEDDGHEDAAAAALAVPWGQASPGRGRQDFQARLGDEAKFIPRYRSIVKCYFRRADGVLLLYDVTRVESFLNVQEWVREIKDAATENTPIMLVGNKADLRDAAAEVQRCVPRYYGEKQAMKYGALFCETSAKDGSKIKEAVLRLAREVKKRTKKDDSKSIINLTEGSSKQSTRKKSCCKR